MKTAESKSAASWILDIFGELEILGHENGTCPGKKMMYDMLTLLYMTFFGFFEFGVLIANNYEPTVQSQNDSSSCEFFVFLKYFPNIV